MRPYSVKTLVDASEGCFGKRSVSLALLLLAWPAQGLITITGMSH